MSLFVAAIGAAVTAIFELTVGPYLRVGDAQPHFVFVLAVVCTIAIGLETGLAWGFVGGIVLDVLAERPIGSSSFALIIVVGIAAVIGRLFIRLRPLVVAPAVALLSLVYSMTLFVLLTALHASAAPSEPLSLLGPGVAYDAVVAVIIGPLAVAIHDRRSDQGAMDW
jgi:rod shape-determining protein MreD